MVRISILTYIRWESVVTEKEKQYFEQLAEDFMTDESDQEPIGL